jgi:hypothetical protein
VDPASARITTDTVAVGTCDTRVGNVVRFDAVAVGFDPGQGVPRISATLWLPAPNLFLRRLD